MSLLEHAKHELALLRGDGPDEMQDMIDAHVLKMVELFADEGHSGSSAPYTIRILEKLLRFEPITPLTGEASEWVEVSESVWQNKRCGRVFKDAIDGEAYDIDGKVFVEPDGCAYTSFESRVPVIFPYTPKTEYVDVPAQFE